MKAKHWDRHNFDDRMLFAQFLDPLVIASRTKNFTTAEASVYLLTLADVPRDILALGVTRLLEQGVTWMPKPGDIKAACADVVDERRKEAGRLGKALMDECPDCHGSGLRDIEGDNRVAKCTCLLRAIELMAQVEAPIERPALPPHDGPEAA